MTVRIPMTETTEMFIFVEFLALSSFNKPDSNCRDINTIPDSSNSELKAF